MSEVVEKKFQKLVRELARSIRAEADAGLSVKKPKSKTKSQTNSLWASAYLDARWFSDAEGFTSKLRVVLPNGDLYGLLRVTGDMKTLLDKIWRVRKQDSSATWYGLKVTVSPDGMITTDLNNDPNCVVDPTWFKS